MDDKISEDREKVEEFRRLYQKWGKKRDRKNARENFARKGGFFRTKRRKQLLGLLGKSGGRYGKNTEADFWYDVREQVTTALIDLLLFIRTTEDKDLHQVLKKETLQPIVEALFLSYSIRDIPKPNADKAKIALMFIEKSLEYLRRTTTSLTTSSQERMIADALDISKQLTALLLSDSERIAILMEERESEPQIPKTNLKWLWFFPRHGKRMFCCKRQKRQR